MSVDREDEAAASKLGAHRERINRAVDALCGPSPVADLEFATRERSKWLPARGKIIECAEELCSVLFPGYYGYREFGGETVCYHIGAKLDHIACVLRSEIVHATRYVEGFTYSRQYAPPSAVNDIVDGFIDSLPEVKRKLLLDARASYEWDPAVAIPEAPIFCYPNMRAMMVYRTAHELYNRGVPFIPRIMTEYAHTLTGIDIHPGAQIGESCFIDHGTGVVIGQTCELGDRVRLYQGVTLGVKRFELDDTGRPKKGVPRHPVLEDDVVVYAMATILGRVTVGRGSVIGANVLLTSSVPPGSMIVQQPSRINRANKNNKSA